KTQKDVVLGLKAESKPIKWLTINTKMFNYRETDYVFATFLDVTEKYKLNEEVSLAKDRLKNALLGNDLGVWDYNALTGELFFSDDWKDIMGFDFMSSKTAFSQWQELIYPADRDIVLETLSDYMSD